MRMDHPQKEYGRSLKDAQTAGVKLLIQRSPHHQQQLPARAAQTAEVGLAGGTGRAGSVGYDTRMGTIHPM